MIRRLRRVAERLNPLTPASSGGEVVGPAGLPEVGAAVLPTAEQRARYRRSESQAADGAQRDYLFLEPDAGTTPWPEVTFDALRWGGEAFVVAGSEAALNRAVAGFRGRPEWFVADGSLRVAVPRWAALRRLKPRWRRRLDRWAGLGPRLRKTRHVASVRKVLIDPPGRLTAKHSYDVRLEPAADAANRAGLGPEHWEVVKRVPTMRQAVERLRQTCPGVPPRRLDAIAAKLVNKVFPIFLTREAALLKLLERDLPEPVRGRVPRVLSMQTEGGKLVREVRLTWLRQGGEPMSHTRFAREAAEMVRALHESAGILHLDLRLDNLVVTDAGVGVVDFGSAVRVGEDFSGNPMLQTLVREMLAASQVTRDLARQREKDLIRGDVFAGLPDPPSPAFDLFALVSNMTRPHDNPDFKGLVQYDRRGRTATRLSKLRRQVLKPEPDDPSPIRDVGGLCMALGTGTLRVDETPDSQPEPDALDEPVDARPAPAAR
ncbi:MAG: hypothetical protein AAF800_03585 [Planctomycetota bacterium]